MIRSELRTGISQLIHRLNTKAQGLAQEWARSKGKRMGAVRSGQKRTWRNPTALWPDLFED